LTQQCRTHDLIFFRVWQSNTKDVSQLLQFPSVFGLRTESFYRLDVQDRLLVFDDVTAYLLTEIFGGLRVAVQIVVLNLKRKTDVGPIRVNLFKRFSVSPTNYRAHLQRAAEQHAGLQLDHQKVLFLQDVVTRLEVDV